MLTSNLSPITLYSLCLLLAFSFLVRSDDWKTSQDCRDHPRLGSACKNVHNLRAWCDRSRLQSDKVKNNLAQVCRATCGFCNVGSLPKSAQPSTQLAPPAATKAVLPLLPIEKYSKLSQKLGLLQSTTTTTRSTTSVLTTTTASPCGRPPQYDACVPLSLANLVFQQCCQATGIGATCLHLCRYDVKVEEVQLAAFKQECPFSILPTYFTCAARSVNNTNCCKDIGVLTEAGPQCEPFCNPTGGALESVGIKHLRCAMYLEEIMQCHWAGLR